MITRRNDGTLAAAGSNMDHHSRSELNITFSREPDRIVAVHGNKVHCFDHGGEHRHERTIAAFGEEWKKFSTLTEEDIRVAGDEYFDIVPAVLLGPGTIVLDLGCGNGRWSRYLSPKVGRIEAIDPSDAIFSAAATHSDLPNVRWSQAGVEAIPFADDAFDLVVCLGVLHHVPDTAEALHKMVRKVKPGGHVLIYLYYALENRGFIYRSLFSITEVLRKLVQALPGPIKRTVAEVIAFTVYLPLRSFARAARAIDRKARWWRKLPLSYYHNKSMRILRNDALDRFGTPLGQRFTKERIEAMMTAAGLIDLRFSPNAPYWHVLGRKR